jgi:hypothetical protein
MAKMDGPGGPGLKHIYFCQCLKGAADDWYCNVLEYKLKLYWDLLQATFSAHWNPSPLLAHQMVMWQLNPYLLSQPQPHPLLSTLILVMWHAHPVQMVLH